MQLRAPAKINLYLRVGPRRADGFHDLVSWFCCVGLADLLEFSPNATGQVTLSCTNPNVPTDQRNLILKAADSLRPNCEAVTGVHIHLHKVIPMGGGLGGGSSNAAAALRGLAMLWKCGLGEAELGQLAAKLGSDVPFFLHPPAAICRGRGERIAPAASPAAQWVLLILPGIEMPTPPVYRRFDEMKLGTDLQQVEKNLPKANLPTDQLLQELVNDLESPAFALSPQLGELRANCEKILRRPVRMSGSGSTLFTLFDDEEEAEQAARLLAAGPGTKATAHRLGGLP